VQIRDASGEVVRRLDLGTHEAGLTAFVWDGVTDGGERAPPGVYTLAAEHRNGNETIGADTLVSAPVESVVFGANGFTVQLRGVGEVPFSAVREIRKQ
jgi:flagellar basal-body rod modification protein FlgD